MLQKITRNIQQAKFYSVMGANSNKEQLVLYIRWVTSSRKLYRNS